jgi:hypothetical protein
MEFVLFVFAMIFTLKVFKWSENNGRTDKELAKKKEMDEFKSSLDQLKNTVINSYNLKPCPKCFEERIAILKISETGQSAEYCCANCNKKITSKLLPNKDGLIAVEQVKSLMKKFNISNLSHRIFYNSEFVDTSFRINTQSDVKIVGRKRKVIPESVRNEVWRRDQGKCVNCQSQNKLEFDHIIPFSKGGSDTVRNIQLLCENCNRLKSNKI